MPSAQQRALQLYGIISLDVGGSASPVRGATVIAFRDLGALVSESPYAAPTPSPQHIAEYRRRRRGRVRATDDRAGALRFGVSWT